MNDGDSKNERKNEDEVETLAFWYLENKDRLLDECRSAFANLPAAPLSALIIRFLDRNCKYELAPLLRSIADVNQGRPEDLDVSTFRSYLITKCSTNETDINKAIRALLTFYKLETTVEKSSGALAIAARSEEGHGFVVVDASDVLKQVTNRVK